MDCAAEIGSTGAFELGSGYVARAIEMTRGIKRKMQWKNLVTVSQKN